MRLIKLAEKRWKVYVLSRLDSDGKDKSQVLDFLVSLKRNLALKMKPMLNEYVPTNGPPKHNENMSKHLRDGIYEFKRGPKRGKKLRVLYFYGGEGQIVICTEAFTKGEETPQEAIDRAIKLKEEFFKIKEGKANSKIEVVELNDTDYKDTYGRL